MAIIDFLKKQFIDIIEWTDDSRDTLSFRFPDEDKEIKNGAQLIVRESQVAQFVYLGEFGDTFGPGKHTLTTDNIPILTNLKGWKYALESPFKADVYYVVTRAFHRQQVGHGQSGDDARRGLRRRARCAPTAPTTSASSTSKKFLKEVAGTDDHFRLDEFADTMRSRIVSVFSDALARREDPGARRRVALHRAGRGAAAAHQSGDRREVRPRDDDVHRRERLGAAGSRAGDRQALEHGGGRQPERLRQVPDGAGHGEGRRRRRAASAAEMAVGMAMAQQMMNQTGGLMAQSTPGSRSPPAAGRGGGARAAVRRRRSRRCSASAKSDVVASLESGRPQGQEDRHAMARHARRGRCVPAGHERRDSRTAPGADWPVSPARAVRPAVPRGAGSAQATTVQRVARDWLALVDKLDAEASWKRAGARLAAVDAARALSRKRCARTRAARECRAARRGSDGFRRARPRLARRRQLRAREVPLVVREQSDGSETSRSSVGAGLHLARDRLRDSVTAAAGSRR